MKRYAPWSLEKSPILVWLQEHMALVIQAFLNVFTVLRAQKKTQYNNQRILSNAQSRALIKWINQLTERGLPPTNSMLENFAREISGKEPGKNWASRWVKAHSDKVISRYSKGLDLERKKADSAYKYALYFALIGRKIEQYNLGPEQIYNMDEKGFMLGVSTQRKRIFTRRKYEQGGYKQHVQDGNREWITTIGCICANGTAISPALNLYGKIRLLYRILGFKILIPRTTEMLLCSLRFRMD